MGLPTNTTITYLLLVVLYGTPYKHHDPHLVVSALSVFQGQLEGQKKINMKIYTVALRFSFKSFLMEHGHSMASNKDI